MGRKTRHRLQALLELYVIAATLIPVYSHRYAFSAKDTNCPAILSIYQSDMIVYGWNWHDYLLREWVYDTARWLFHTGDMQLVEMDDEDEKEKGDDKNDDGGGDRKNEDEYDDDGGESETYSTEEEDQAMEEFFHSLFPGIIEEAQEQLELMKQEESWKEHESVVDVLF